MAGREGVYIKGGAGLKQLVLFSLIQDIIPMLNAEEALNNHSSAFYNMFLFVALASIIIGLLLRNAAIHKKNLDVLQKSRNEYRMIFQSMQEGFALFEIISDRNGKPEEYNLIDVNPAFEVITGFSSGQVMGRAFYNLLHEIDTDNLEKLNEVAMTGIPINYEGYLKSNGKHLLVNLYKPEEGKLAVIFSDITQKKLAEELIQKQNLSFEALFRNSTDAIVLFDEKHVVSDINEKFTALFGYEIDEVRGREVDSIIASGENLVEANQLTGDLLGGHEISIESIRFGSDGEAREVSVKGVPIILNNRIIGGYGIYSDISHRKRAEKEIVYMNYHDQLTGLYNRRFLEEEIRRLDTGRNLPISAIMADVNSLKLYNDAFGHAEGDKLLVKAAETIKNECRSDEIVARLGGDEFVILLPKTESEGAEKIIKRIKSACSAIRLQSMELSISFGWDTKEDAADDMNEIIKRAEDNMYRDKLFESSSKRGKTIQTIINSLHEKNWREEQHSQRVGYLCEAIGIAMGKNEIELNKLNTVGLLHDIGKIAIDEEILNKPGKLTIEEWSEIMRHPEIGYRILSSVKDMAEFAEFVLAHHERWDGKGYPKGLKGEEIPLHARIIAVADAFDAMTGERAYRDSFSEEAAVKELERNADTQFDPEIVRVFVENKIYKKYKNFC